MNSYLRMIQSVTTKYDTEIRNSTSSFCEYFGIDQFWFHRINDKGFLGTISNNPAWCEYFAAEKLFHKCPLLRHSKYIPLGFVVVANNEVEDFLDNKIAQTFYKDIKKYKNGIWFVIINKTETGSEQFGFMIDKSNLALIINELQIIKQFMNKLPTKIPRLFSKLEEAQVNLVDLMGASFYKSAIPAHFQPQAREVMIQNMGLESDIQLNPRELEVIKLVLQGHSPSQIAPKVFLAKRTIEHLLEKIKEKLECNSKTQLIQKAREMENFGLF